MHQSLLPLWLLSDAIKECEFSEYAALCVLTIKALSECLPHFRHCPRAFTCTNTLAPRNHLSGRSSGRCGAMEPQEERNLSTVPSLGSRQCLFSSCFGRSVDHLTCGLPRSTHSLARVSASPGDTCDGAGGPPCNSSINRTGWITHATQLKHWKNKNQGFCGQTHLGRAPASSNLNLVTLTMSIHSLRTLVSSLYDVSCEN